MQPISHGFASIIYTTENEPPQEKQRLRDFLPEQFWHEHNKRSIDSSEEAGKPIEKHHVRNFCHAQCVRRFYASVNLRRESLVCMAAVEMWAIIIQSWTKVEI